MKHKQYEMPGDTLFRLAILVALTIAYLCSGCEVFKNTKQSKSDTLAVKRSLINIDSSQQGGTVRTVDNRAQEENEWFRLTMKYLADNKQGDTTINQFITQPATVIYESGKSSRNEEKKITDSSWYLSTMKFVATAVDSISRKVDNYEKTKHSKTRGIAWMGLLFTGIALVGGFVSRKWLVGRLRLKSIVNPVH